MNTPDQPDDSIQEVPTQGIIPGAISMTDPSEAQLSRRLEEMNGFGTLQAIINELILEIKNATTKNEVLRNYLLGGSNEITSITPSMLSDLRYLKGRLATKAKGFLERIQAEVTLTTLKGRNKFETVKQFIGYVNSYGLTSIPQVLSFYNVAVEFALLESKINLLEEKPRVDIIPTVTETQETVQTGATVGAQTPDAPLLTEKSLEIDALPLVADPIEPKVDPVPVIAETEQLETSQPQLTLERSQTQPESSVPTPAIDSTIQGAKEVVESLNHPRLNQLRKLIADIENNEARDPNYVNYKIESSDSKAVAIKLLNEAYEAFISQGDLDSVFDNTVGLNVIASLCNPEIFTTAQEEGVLPNSIDPDFYKFIYQRLSNLVNSVVGSNDTKLDKSVIARINAAKEAFLN